MSDPIELLRELAGAIKEVFEAPIQTENAAKLRLEKAQEDVSEYLAANPEPLDDGVVLRAEVVAVDYETIGEYKKLICGHPWIPRDFPAGPVEITIRRLVDGGDDE